MSAAATRPPRVLATSCVCCCLVESVLGYAPDSHPVSPSWTGSISSLPLARRRKRRRSRGSSLEGTIQPWREWQHWKRYPQRDANPSLRSCPHLRVAALGTARARRHPSSYSCPSHRRPPSSCLGRARSGGVHEPFPLKLEGEENASGVREGAEVSADAK